MLPPTPTPPSTTNVPVLVLVLGVDDPAEKVIDPELAQIYVLYPFATLTDGVPVVLDAAVYVST
jgi:hypothetical protein